MKTLCAVVLGVCAIVFVNTARADDDNAKKILGVWVLEKSGNDLPEGSTIEFTNDGKLKAILKDKSGDLNLTGIYKITRDKLAFKVTHVDSNTNHEETVTIKKLTDKVLEVADKDSRIETFKRKK
jgi:uncharacterized protein (TIGR03066 family)